MKNFVKSLSKGWKIFIAVFIMSTASQAAVNRPYLGCFYMLVFLAWVILCVVCRREKAAEDSEKLRVEKERQALLDAKRLSVARKEREEREAREQEWQRTHGRFVCKLAGVTFDNEDGTSRQKLLREFYCNDFSSVGFQSFVYKGEDAVHVTVDGEIVGSIPKNRLEDFFCISDKITSAYISIEPFSPKEDDKPDIIYRADVNIVYQKN